MAGREHWSAGCRRNDGRTRRGDEKTKKRVSRLRKGIQTPPTTEPPQDPVTKSDFSFPGGIRYPIPFCHPEDLFGGRCLTLFRGEPSLFAETLTQTVHAPHDESVKLPLDLLEEWLSFEPESEFQPALVVPREFARLCDEVAAQISSLKTVPEPNPYTPLLPNIFTFPRVGRESSNTQPTGSYFGNEHGGASSVAQLSGDSHLAGAEQQPSAICNVLSNPGEKAIEASFSEAAVSRDSHSRLSRGVLPFSELYPPFFHYFQRFLEAGLRVPDIPEAIAYCVQQERSSWEKKLSCSMQQSLQKARRNKGKKFNRFACKVSWPPVPACNPWSERNLWSRFRTIAEDEQCRSFCLAFDLCTTRFDRHYMTHNFAVDQHRVLRKVHEKASLSGPRRAGDHQHTPDRNVEIAASSKDEHQFQDPLGSTSCTTLGNDVTDSRPTRHYESSTTPTPSGLGAAGDVSASEIILTVSFSHSRKGTKLAEFDVLASQTLAHLRDAFHCEADFEPGVRRCLGSCFLIDGILYPDLRDASALDYSAMIVEHLRRSYKIASNKRSICQSHARLDTARIMLQGRCAFLHQGDCEHRVVFTSMRRFNRIVDCPFRQAYPIRTFKPSLRRQMCQACSKQLATCSIANSAFFCTPQNPTFLCQKCRESLAEDINDPDAIEFKVPEG